MTDKQLIFAVLLCVPSFLGVNAQKTVSMTVSATTKYQYIDGFGGCGMSGQWADIYDETRTKLLWGQAEKNVGLNIMRIRINPNEGNWGEYGNAVKYARKANSSLQVFATPWTPPKMYKTGKTTKYQNEFGTWVWPIVEHSWGGQGSNGGTINTDSIPAYARFLERYRATMEKKGCPIDIISIQNECDYTPTATDNGVEHASYESCIFSPNQMAKMVKELKSVVDPKCKVMGPETFGWGQTNYNTTLAAKADAVESIDIWGNHQYGSDSYGFVNTVRNKTKKNMWMTEYLIDYSKEYASDFGADATYKGEFKYEYKMINTIETALKAGYSAYVYYNMNDDFFASRYGGSNTTLNKRAQVFAHYAKYATGKNRISSYFSGTYAGNLKAGSSYLSLSGDTVVSYVLNPTTEEYKLIVNLPIDAEKILAVVTNDAVNRRVIDLTESYTPGSKKLTTTLYPGSFYTFIYIKNMKEDGNVVTPVSKKGLTFCNPLSAIQYMADPTAVEYNGRLYVYATNDQQQYDYSYGLATNSYNKITQLVCMSTEDMVNWTHHGTIDVKAAAPWIYTSWAPSIVSREEGDGKTHFYLYFTNSAAGIGVLTATSPLGPWTDPLGKALIDGSTPGLGTMSNIIDPGALVDGDRAYLAFGGGDVQSGKTDQYPGNARIVELGNDMISLKGDIINVDAPYHFEANELNKIGSKIVFSYCSRWSDPTAAAAMRYIVADSITGKWTSKGVFMKNPGTFGYPYGNNHTHFQKFKGYSHILYHTQALEHSNGIDAGYRNLAVNRLFVTESTARITSGTMSTSGAPVFEDALPTVGEVFQAETFSNAVGVKCSNDAKAAGNTLVTNVKAGSWMLVRSVNFPEGVKESMEFAADVEGRGCIEVRLDSINAAPIAVLVFNNETLQQSSTAITGDTEKYEAGKHNVYLVFTSASGVKFDAWQIKGNAADGISNVTAEKPSAASQTYNILGQKVSDRKPGQIYIVGKKKVRY